MNDSNRNISTNKGSLTVVGLGIFTGRHTTLGAEKAIRESEKVLFAVADRQAAEWILTLNRYAEPLEYDIRRPRRREVYQEMVLRILEEVRAGTRLCVVFYGHPGVFAYAPHKAIQQARREGFAATMQPGVSAEDCLIADLGIDPGPLGLRTFEATDFLIRPRPMDTSTALVLWQLGTLGNLGFWCSEDRTPPAVKILVDVLKPHYGASHRVYVYEAATQSSPQTRISPCSLGDLASVDIGPLCTLFVPAIAAATLDATMMRKLNVFFGPKDRAQVVQSATEEKSGRSPSACEVDPAH